MEGTGAAWPSTPDDCARLRAEGDPPADAVIAAIAARGELEAVSALLGQLVRDDQAPPETLPPEVRAFLDAAGLPRWADPARIRRGEELFERHGVLMLASLLLASLPECYADRRGVPVLWMSQQLEAHARRRLYETAQMVVAVMCEGGLSPRGQGIRAAQRVRLMHASMRHLILAEPEQDRAKAGSLADVMLCAPWEQELGVPINQEDLALTLMTFSHVILRAIADLGVVVDEADREAYVHCWNVVGHVMGVRDDLLPADAAAAERLFEWISGHESGTTPEGRDMTAALLATVRDALPFFVPGRLPQVVARHLVGDAKADLVGIPQRDAIRDLPAVMLMWVLHALERVASRGLSRIPGAKGAAEILGRALVKALTRIPRGWQRELFALPDHLAVAWGIEAKKA